MAKSTTRRSSNLANHQNDVIVLSPDEKISGIATHVAKRGDAFGFILSNHSYDTPVFSGFANNSSSKSIEQASETLETTRSNHTERGLFLSNLVNEFRIISILYTCFFSN